MKWPLGWSRVVTWLSGVLVAAYLLQTVGGRVTSWTSLGLVVGVTLGTAWAYRGASRQQWKPRAALTALALVLFSLGCHGLFPGVKIEQTVLLSQATVSPVGENLSVEGSVERVGQHLPVSITISSPSVSTVLVVAPDQQHFSAILPVGLANPCSTFVTVEGPSHQVLSPLWCTR